MQVRQLMAEKRVLVTGVAVVAAAVAVALVAAFWPGDESKAGAAIQVIEGAGGETKTTEFDSRDKAVEYASDKAGFDFATPPAVPDGFDLVGITVGAPNPRAPELGPKRVTLQYMRGEEGFSVLVMDRPFAASGAATSLPSSVGELYRLSVGPATAYILITDDRGYQLNMNNPPVLDEAEATALLESFVE